jgi:ectoine hydroxylase
MLTHDQILAYERDGFVLVKDMFDREELDILLENSDSDRIQQGKFDLKDASGRESKLALWHTIGDDVWGAVTNSPRIVNSCRALLRDEIYHWHSKLMLKEPRVGGAWEWHQDYGYWYSDGCLFPRMLSCLIALNDANRENGCLKVLVGSHELGRVNHGHIGTQAGIDPERVYAIEERFPLKYVEAPAGSALFFHGNLLHSSEANLSERARTSYICCYNAISNIPYGGKGHGAVEPIHVSADDAVLQFALKAA